MDIATYLQCFESRLGSYTGDDPLEPWDKFVEYMEQKLPADGDGAGMSVVFDSLVQRFLNVERYANDIRFVNHCIKCASYYSDPVALYSHIFGRGVGTRTAALYVAWARQFEQRGLAEQADAVFQKAVENQAQPADAVLHEYRQFQARTRSQNPESGVNPLQKSHLTNQMSSHRDPVAQSKASVDCPGKPATLKTVITLSRSENSGVSRGAQSSGVVSEYLKDELLCEGSEFCFEEVRAEKHFLRLRERQEKERRDNMEKKLREQEEGIRNIKSMLEKVQHNLENCGASGIQTPSQAVGNAPDLDAACVSTNATQNPFVRPLPSNRLSSRRSLGLTLLTESPFVHDATPQRPPSHFPSQHAPVLGDRGAHLAAAPDLPSVVPGVPLQDVPGERLENVEEKLNVSQGGTGNLSHITPNNSLGYIQATPSRVLPSPTVNTREALDVIMDMFQAPTLLEDPFRNTSAFLGATEEAEFQPAFQRNGGEAAPAHPPPPAPFTIFQDDADKENGSAAAPPPAPKAKPTRALAEISAAKPEKPNDTPTELMPDESTMWGARYNSLHSLHACPNSTTDFALSARFVSTPSAHKTPLGNTFFPEQENTCDGGETDEEAFVRRQPKKLSPIMEQSPSDEKLGASRLLPSSGQQGTIVEEAHLLLATSSLTMVQPPPPAVLSFRDHTLGSAESGGPLWEVYTSPEPPREPRCRSFGVAGADPEAPVSPGAAPRCEPFGIMEDPEVPMSPDPASLLSRPPRSQPFQMATDPEVHVGPEPGLRPVPRSEPFRIMEDPEVPMSPEPTHFLSRPPRSQPFQVATDPEVPMSPDCGPRAEPDAFLGPLRPWSQDVPMSPEREEPMSPVGVSRKGAEHLVADPWDEQLVSGLLSALIPPLTSHPACVSWPRSLPSISPKSTIHMGSASLRVDCVLGQGAFATVYQATDPRTSERVVLKVQKPANPWEFYINTRLDARLQPAVRGLYGRVSSAHLFTNGSVLVGELHNYGTLLNAINLFKGLSDRVMPQPLAMFFAVCVLQTVEQLHAVHVVHADIKPDNFLLGERFLENKTFRPEVADHGLVLVDMGQSIDMELFPEGTAFTAKCLTSGFQCTEMLSGKPWSYQTDYFGIAGTVYCLLFGTYMQVTQEGGVWKTNAAFRRNPHADLWLDFFRTLLNVPDGGPRPCLGSLRRRLTDVLQRDYASKLATLKSRLVVLLLESHKAGRR